MHHASAFVVAFLMPIVALGAGCRLEDRALGDSGAAEVDAPPADARFLAERPVLGPPDADVAVPLSGSPVEMGCADGTREGFLSLVTWPDVAACGGGWQVPGMVGSTPQCNQTAGDSSSNPAGVGCAAADLCAVSWHVCASASELSRRSPTGCESATGASVWAFYAIATGSTEAGTCLRNPVATNDLHGCGTFGQPEDESCSPLIRRLGFADCARSAGTWSCGTADDATREASLVTKDKPTGGGVICCRDPAPP